MKKLTTFCLLLGAMAIGLTGCYKDDINDLKRTQAEQDELLAQLANWKTSVDQQIAVIRQLAEESDGYVTDVKAKYGDNDEVIGIIISYGNADDKEILFSQSELPVIGLRLDEQTGLYYWTVTVDGETADILVNGESVIATGPQGETPVVSLRPGTANDVDPENFYWQVAIGNGNPVDILVNGNPVPATGEKGDSWFLGYIDNGDYYSFILNDGAPEGENATLDVVKYKPNGLILDEPVSYEIETVATPVPYSFIIPDELLEVFVLEVSEGWAVNVDRTAQTLYVDAPSDNDPAGYALLLAVGAKGVTYSYVMNLTTEARVFGSLFYDGGVVTGIVVKENDGTPGSGMAISLVQRGPFTNSKALGIVTTTAWRKAQNWADGLGQGWRLYRTADYRDLYVAILAGGIANLNAALVAQGADEVLTDTYYWTGESNGIGLDLVDRADAFGFWGDAPGATFSAPKTKEGYYARAIKKF